MENSKTYTLEIVSAEAWSMETDHFQVKNPKTNVSKRINPHDTDLRKNSEDHQALITVWRAAVQVLIDNREARFELQKAEELTSYEANQRIPVDTIELTMAELNLIKKYAE